MNCTTNVFWPSPSLYRVFVLRSINYSAPFFAEETILSGISTIKKIGFVKEKYPEKPNIILKFVGSRNELPKKYLRWTFIHSTSMRYMASCKNGDNKRVFFNN